MPTDPIQIPDPSPERRVFTNRTLNMRSIKAIGYDMDYTLTQYHAEAWEERAFAHARDRLAALGWPVDQLEFDATAVSRGLVMDLDLGNLLKATRFGWVIRAMHGTSFLDYQGLRRTYSGTLVDLSEDRYVFLNTLFSLSEASLFAQCVDLLDDGMLPSGIGYSEIFSAVRAAVDGAHRDGMLKEDVLADPERYIALDGDIVACLRDQQHAGKRLMLITNSDWSFANAMMTYTFDPFLPEGQTWRDLFGTVIVSAAKPDFFTSSNALYKVVDEDLGLLEPHHGSIEKGGVFYGGNARLVEESLGLSGDQILYVGDHLYGDVHFSKALLRWRTALILQELESEVRALDGFLPAQRRLGELMEEKEALEARLSAAPPRRASNPRRLRHADDRRSRCSGGDHRDAQRRPRTRRCDRSLRHRGGAPQKRVVGADDARRRRQEPARPPGRALRRHLHVTRLEPALPGSLRDVPDRASGPPPRPAPYPRN